MKPKFSLKNIKGDTVLQTSAGTSVLKGSPKVVATKFGNYLVFPTPVDDAPLTQTNLKHRVFNEFEVNDKSRAVIFRQVKTTADKSLRKGDWHVAATQVSL